MRILIRNGHIIDPGHFVGAGDLLIENGKVAEIRMPDQSSAGESAASGKIEGVDRIIDATGNIVTPGLVDMHVHLREPGQEHKETIESGCRAAAHGGFTAVCSMPNTSPVNDNPEVTLFILDKARSAGTVRVHPAGCISVGSKGKTLCNFQALKDAGAVALSDDGWPVIDSLLMRRGLECAKELGFLVISHSEDTSLARGGVINEGQISARLGLPGIPNAAESIMVMRDISLCELTGARLHIAHVSTRQSVDLIREAKERGVPVTAETAPHYFTLTDEAVVERGSNAKMNPPLRSTADRDAIRQGLADGTIDAIATDHAPHSSAEKTGDISKAANGILGLETSLPLSLKLVDEGVVSLETLIEKMALNPSRILGLKCGLAVGSAADLTIIDTAREHTVNADRFQSLSRNTPFDGWHVKGKAVLTMVGGRIVFEE